MEERRLSVGTPEDNFRLVYCRGKETALILEFLKESPIVFLYSAAGNGKTSFGVEFRERVPDTALILGAQLGTEEFRPSGLYDRSFSESSIIIVDEFGGMFSNRQIINDLISKGKKFIFMQHYPKKRYIDWQKQHHEYDALMVGLINDYPNAQWFHLSKWRNK